MRKLLTAALAAVALAPAARAVETKIAVMDYQKALVTCDEGKAILAALKKEMEEKQKQLDAKKKEFADKRADFDKQAAVINDEAKQAKVAELEKFALELQQTFVDLQQEFAAKENEAYKGVAGRIRALVKEIANDSGIQVVLDASSVVWASDTYDITSEVIRKYNAKYPVKPGAAPKPAGGAKPKGGK